MKLTMQRRTGATEFRAEERDGQMVIEGYFSVFNSEYSGPGWKEIIAPGAFNGETGGDVRALTNHDTTLVLGRTTAGTLVLYEDERGLFGRVQINPDDSDARNLYARVKRGDVTQCSIGFDILAEDREVDEDTGEVLFIIRKVKLYEVSVVTFPAYTETEVEARAADAQRERSRTLEAWKEKQRRRLGK